MAATKTEYYFYPGRNGKTGNSGPGNLVVLGKYKFWVNQVNKDKSVFEMYCHQQGNPEFSCKAKETIDKSDNGSFFCIHVIQYTITWWIKLKLPFWQKN